MDNQLTIKDILYQIREELSQQRSNTLVILDENGGEIIDGDNDDNELEGSPGDDEINGRGGNDTISGNDGNDTINGGVGDDEINGGDGKDNLTGSDGNDILDGGLGNDQMRGSDGDDIYVVDSENDATRKEKADGGLDEVQASLDWTLGKNIENLSFTVEGDFTGTGNNLDNTLTGNGGRNRLLGRDGADFLIAGDGNDRLFAGEGADILVGDPGDDQLTGDEGDDVFAFFSPSDGTDTITDFNVETEFIFLSGDGFGINAEEFSEEQFHLGAAAETEQQLLIYNPDNSTLFYDADGTGSTEQVPLAIFEGSVTLSFNNVLVL